MVSIIVPVYNAASYIKKTIETVEEQTYTDWELILVDDCSKDNSAEIIEECIAARRKAAGEHSAISQNTDQKAVDSTDNRIRLVRQPHNAGAAEARNRGIDEAKGRFIAFLDADDVWRSDKLEKQLQFMQKHDATFVFTAYEFGDENAIPTGKRVRVPKRLTYKEALSRTIIFTSTVLIDTEKIDKALIHMPSIGSEDTATWWQILKTGVTAYGLDQPLAVYRRPATSLSSNKGKAVERIWNLYRNVAGLSPAASLFYMFLWAYRATVRRVLDDTVRSHLETMKRFTVVQLSMIGILLHTAVYGVIWFKRLYPVISSERWSREGFYYGQGLRLYFRGHILILVIYFILLSFLSQTSGGMKTGYHKPGNIFSSQILALVITNVVTYFQLSLMRNWLLPPVPFAIMLSLQILIAGAWAFLSDLIYRHVFPPRETLVLNLSPASFAGTVSDPEKSNTSERQENTSLSREDEKDLQYIVDRFNTRQDRFKVMKTLQCVQHGTRSNLEEIKKECLRWYGCVVVSGGSYETRKEITEFCYLHYIRVYLIPEISDLLIQGSEHMDLFDIPILELKEYSIRWESRVVKRLIDIVFSVLALVVTSPYYLVKALRGKKEFHTTVTCLTKDAKEFELHVGCKWLNVLTGQMSIVGPAPTEAAAAKELVEKDSRYYYRYRVKPGMIGYSQTYGREEKDELSKLKMDIYYIQHFSLMNDFKLMLQALRLIRS